MKSPYQNRKIMFANPNLNWGKSAGCRSISRTMFFFVGIEGNLQICTEMLHFPTLHPMGWEGVIFLEKWNEFTNL